MGIYIGGPGNDIINSIASAATSFGLEDDRVSTFAGDDVVYTGAGNDFIDAGDGNDILYDGDGNDTVYGGDGNDKVQVDAGNDVFYGGRDNDTLCFDVIHIGAGGEATSFQGAKIDLSLDSAQNLGEFGIDLFFGFESVLGSYGNDTLLGTNDLNVLNGQQGNDILYGRGGDDILDGDIEADTLVGGLGSDEILLGRILMSPDSSRDVVRYENLKDSGATASTRDEILWFKPGQDKIDLSKIDANLGLKGNQAFKVVTGFTKAFGEIKLVKSSFDTLVQIDGDKDSFIDMTMLVKYVNLTKADFIL